MNRIIIIFSIFFLIIFTTFIKNSSKKIEDKIFIKNEVLRNLNKEFQNYKLENDYLSSAEKLMEYHISYFDNELMEKKIEQIEILNFSSNRIIIERLNFNDY
tara:strand:+ start:1011 stop:1316 length:306 start_codon:yes stop_codon:yes gene_type:complete